MEQSKARTVLLIAFIFLVFYVVWDMFYPAPQKAKVENISFTDFLTAVEAGRVKSVEISGAEITGTITDQGKFANYFITRKESGYNVSDLLIKNKVSFNNVYKKEPIWLGIVQMLFYAAIFIGVFMLISRYSAKKQGQGSAGDIFGFGKAKVREYNGEDDKITFADVAGIDEVKEELQEIVDYLRGNEDCKKLGGRIPKGVLLLGPSGVGKTYVARAVAGEAEVPFLHISGSDFVEMFVGVGASRVRSLFEQARKKSPCILFIDEIDAMGQTRGRGIGGGNDEREQTLNSILVEMDGFSPNCGIIIIGATNRPYILDAALLRPGRFDRKINVPIPDINGRCAILKVHSKGKTLAESVDLMTVARGTIGMTGADLANILNEAALLAGRRKKEAIEMADIEDAVERVIMGKARVVKIADDEKKVIAYHEAGHALVGLNCAGAEPLHKISIVPRGNALGVTVQLPIEDKHLMSKRQLENNIFISLGGRAAEELIFGKDGITTGASNDLERATELLRQAISKYGLDEEFGLASFGDASGYSFFDQEAMRPGMSQGMKERIEERVRDLLAEKYDKAKRILATRLSDLNKLAAALLERETLSAEDVKKLLEE
jgi:cell division protease FtsH